MPATLELAVLGPLQVTVDGAPVALGERSRALLLLLSLQPGAPVAADQLADRLWPADAPGDARNALQALVSRTRRALGAAGATGDAIVTHGTGYALDLPEVAVDAHRFAATVARARDGLEPSVAVDRLAQVLGTWRGDPYLEVADDPDAQVAAVRLAELRVEAIELQAEAALACGRSDALVPDLRAAAAAHPTRERLQRALAEALYRAGRQTDALAVLDGLIARLRDDLGLDPDPATSRLQRELLQHDQRLEGDAPAQRRVDGPRPLPVPRTSFIGRDAEATGVAAALDTSRMVTLIGPGGSGKTRLAIEIARRRTTPGSADADLGGDIEVAYVELATLTDPDDVLSQVATGLGVDPDVPATGVGGDATSPRPLEERLAQRLEDADLLMVLDNCEHVIDAAAEAVELALDAGPGVRILATSREGLRVPGEVLWAVPPLAVPDAAAADTPQALLSHDAVRLFVDRAHAADVGFELDATTAPAVAEVCRRLDGLPLAIELAAARIATLPVTVLAERLEDRFRLLTGGRRAVRRQETLEAVVAWSHELLDQRQATLFHRLGAFAGSVPVELVEAVVADEILPVDEVLTVLTELADRSLVALEDDDRGLRVRLLETMRAFARNRLLADGDPAGVRARHARFMAQRAETASREIRGRQQLAWLDRVDDELDEYRGALTWTIDTDPATAVAMAADLAWYWWLHDHRLEAVRWLERALDAGSDLAAPATAASAWAWLGFLLVFDNRPDEASAAAVRARAMLADAADPPPFVRAGVPLLAAYIEALCGGDIAASIEQLEGAVATAEPLGEDWVVAAGHYVLAGLADAAGLRARVVPEAELALVAADRAGDRWAQFQTRLLLAGERIRAGDYDAAREHLDRSVVLGEAIGTREQARGVRVQRALVDMLDGDLESARRQLAEVLRSPPVHAHDFSQAAAWHGVAMVARREGDQDAAADAYERADAAFSASGAYIAAAEAAAGRVYVEVARGDVDAATRAMATALQRLQSTDRPLLLTRPFLLEAAAELALAEGDAELALARLGRAAALRQDIGGPLVGGERYDVDRVAARARAVTGDAAARAAMEAGAGRSGLLPPVD